jgi:hypothetical protein
VVADAGHGRSHLGEGRHVQSRPGKSGWPESISARTQPTDQTSIAHVYSLNVSITSGARYHLRAHGSALGPKTKGRRGTGTLSRRIRSGTSSCRSPRSAAAWPSAPGQSRRAASQKRRSVGMETQPRWQRDGVRYLEIAVGVQQQVGRLQVAVQHVGRVEGLERAQRLQTKAIGAINAAAPGQASQIGALTW